MQWGERSPGQPGDQHLVQPCPDRRFNSEFVPSIPARNPYRLRHCPSDSLVHELLEARDEGQRPNLQRQPYHLNLLIIDELGFVPLSPTGAELLFEVFSQRYERGSVMVPTNLPFNELTEGFGSERLTGALLDRLTHHVHILEMNGESYRLKCSRENAQPPAPDDPDEE